jgi:hypothetical protein
VMENNASAQRRSPCVVTWSEAEESIMWIDCKEEDRDSVVVVVVDGGPDRRTMPELPYSENV